jgi:hypothetical protein
MRHAQDIGWDINISLAGSALLGCHNRHVDIVVLDLGKQDLASFSPHQPRGVWQPWLRLPT